MTHSSTWQDVLDPPFVQRLLRPWQHPGCLHPHLTQAIVARYQRPMTPLPLVDQLTRRKNQTATLQSPPQPIGYAHPAPPPDPVASPPSSTPIARPQPTGQPTIIQAKFVADSRSIERSFHAAAAGGSPSSPFQDAELPRSGTDARSPAGSPLAASADLPNLPLIHPAPSAAEETSQPSTRPKRPRFERNTGRQFSDLSDRIVGHQTIHHQIVGDQTELVSSSLPSAAPLPLPFTPAAPNIPAVPMEVEVLPTKAESNHAELPVVGVRSSNNSPNKVEGALTAISPGNGQSLAPTMAPTMAIGQQQRQTSPSPALPLVQSSQLDVLRQQSNHSGVALPLVFSALSARENKGAIFNGASSRFGAETAMSLKPGYQGNPAAAAGRSAKPFQPTVSAQPMTPQEPQPPAVDVEALANKVERKLMRRLVVERERRGGRG